MNSYSQITLATAEAPESIDELAGFLEMKLSRPVSAERLNRIFHAQSELRRRRDDLAKGLIAHSLTKEEYLSGLNGAYREFLDLQLGELGEMDFVAVYGDDAWDIEGVVDPDIFLSGNVGDAAGV